MTRRTRRSAGPSPGGFTIFLGTAIAASAIILESVREEEAGEAAESLAEVMNVMGEIAIIMALGFLLLLAVQGATVAVPAVLERREGPISRFSRAGGDPFTRRSRSSRVDCCVCGLEGEPGFRVEYGREWFALGLLLNRCVEGRNEECVTCAITAPTGRCFRETDPEPESVAGSLGDDPRKAAEAAEVLVK